MSNTIEIDIDFGACGEVDMVLAHDECGEHEDVVFCRNVVRCKDCKYLDMPDWDGVLTMNYGEPPTFCTYLSYNEWRMDGDRRVVETSFLEVSPDDFCAWGERRGE